MKLTLLGLVALVPTTFAQAQNATYLAGFAQALNDVGLTQLATVATSINGTALGQELLAALPTRNWTIFAPDNTAFEAVPANVTSDATNLANILSYHIVSGNFTALTLTFPNVTIGRTLLNNSTFVTLEGNKSQVVAWTTVNGTIEVLNQPNVTVSNTTRFQNVVLYTISGVLEPPGLFPAVLTRENLTTLSLLLSNLSSNVVNVTLGTVLEGARGFTLFAPNDAALMAARSLPNISVEATVIGNHIINGSTVYSSSLTKSANFTSSSGETLSFITNNTGTYVMSGSSVAKIVKSDVLVKNGVVHVIDGVLDNTASNAAAASSAFVSATSIAAQSTTETGPVGTPTVTVSSSPTSSKSGANGLLAGIPGGLISALCVTAGMVAGCMLLG